MVSNFSRLHPAVPVYGRITDVNAFALELSERFEHRWMLNGCRDRVLALTWQVAHETQNRQVVRLCTPTREYKLDWCDSQHPGNAAPGTFQLLPRVLPVAVS